MPHTQINALAYVKAVLHAAKYPSEDVNGIFIGTVEDGSHVNITDAIPLFHSPLNLAPMLEVALMQIDELCKERNLQIVGYYQALARAALGPNGSPDSAAAKDINATAMAIVGKIREHCPRAVTGIIPAAAMQRDSLNTKMALSIFDHGGGDDASASMPVTLDVEPALNSAVSVAAKCVSTHQYKDIIDFDNHLDDVSRQWPDNTTNRFIEQELEVDS